MRFRQCAQNLAAVALLASSLAGCGNAGAIEASSVTDTPTPAPTPYTGHLYVEYGSQFGNPSPDGIAVYALPLTQKSTPLFTSSQPIGPPIAFDQYGNLFTTPGTPATSVVEYRFPFTAKSTPTTVIGPGVQTIPSADVINDLGFDQNGDLWVQTDIDLRSFVPPLSAKSVADPIVAGNGSNLTFSLSGTMYSGPEAVHFGATANIQVFAGFPYTAPAKTLSNVAFGLPFGYFPDGTALVSSSGANVQGQIPNIIYPQGIEVVPSISASTTVPYIVPFTMSVQDSQAHKGAVDGNGVAYVLDGNVFQQNALDVFGYPIVQGSKPQMRISCIPVSGACSMPIGVYVGP